MTSLAAPAGDDRAAAWGDSQLVLALATGRFTFRGLSPRQADLLAARYGSHQAVANGLRETIDCKAIRLPRPLPVDPEMLVCEGVYAMCLRQTPRALEIVGHNFEAWVQWRTNAEALLAVYHEDELAYPSVVENFMRVVTAHHALRAGGLLLHSAGFVIDGRAHIFPGRSGVGKTTMTRKASEAGCPILSDDINLVLPDRAGGLRAYAVPFAGELGLSVDRLDPAGYPVAGIHILRQGKEIERSALPVATAAARLTVSAPFVNADDETADTVLAVAAGIASRASVDELAVGRDTSFRAVRARIEGTYDA